MICAPRGKKRKRGRGDFAPRRWRSSVRKKRRPPVYKTQRKGLPSVAGSPRKERARSRTATRRRKEKKGGKKSLYAGKGEPSRMPRQELAKRKRDTAQGKKKKKGRKITLKKRGRGEKSCFPRKKKKDIKQPTTLFLLKERDSVGKKRERVPPSWGEGEKRRGRAF